MSLLVAAAIALSPRPALADEGAFSVGVPIELDVVGFVVGPRPELLWRPGSAGSVSHVRVALGALFGPEYGYFPAALGWRGRFRHGARVQPFVGAGAELQTFVALDAAPYWRLGWYLEGGVDVRLIGAHHVTLQVAPDLSVGNHLGVGLSTRIGWRFDLD